MKGKEEESCHKILSKSYELCYPFFSNSHQGLCTVIFYEKSLGL